MPTPMKLDPDFKEFVGLLNSHEVRYLIIDGYAVGFHGHARYTKDLDVWIEATPANANALLAVLGEFGFGAIGLTTDDFQVPDQVIQLGREPIRIDLLTSVKGAKFSDAWKRLKAVEVDDVTCKVIGLDDLRSVKAATGRPQDLADIDHLSVAN